MNNFTYYNDEWNISTPIDKESHIGNTSQPPASTPQLPLLPHNNLNKRKNVQ
jgi:hypothetical protein